MRPFYLQILLSCLLLLPAISPAGPASEIIFSARYKLFSGNLEIGESTRVLKKLDGTDYSYESDTYATGMAKIFIDRRVKELSHLRVVNNRIIPVEYSYQKYQGSLIKTITSLFNWDSLLVQNEIDDKEKNKFTRVELPLSSGMLDKLLYQYAIMLDLQNGTLPAKYTVADTRKIKTYHIKKAGTEKINTPKGELQTVKLLQHTNKDTDDKKLMIWCAPDYSFLPVKIETTHTDGKVITALLENVDGL